MCPRPSFDDPITFADYMSRCLYGDDGYYASVVPGRDYVTAATLSPVFGRCIARLLDAMRVALGKPDPFRVVEPGAGDGSLAASALRAVSADWTIVERHARVEALQRERLRGLDVRWTRDLPRDAHVVIANELLDNFPVHLVRTSGGETCEAYVTPDFELTLREPSNARVVEWAEQRVGCHEGWFEVPLAAVDWISSVEASYLLVIDYGDEEPAIYTDRREGTLVSYRRHRRLDPLAAPGESDITAHVNFSAVADAARAVGMTAEPIVIQRDLLEAYGIREELEQLRRESTHAAGARAIEMINARNAASALVARGGLGDFRVLLARGNGVAVPVGWPGATS